MVRFVSVNYSLSVESCTALETTELFSGGWPHNQRCLLYLGDDDVSDPEMKTLAQRNV
jgi:hypothetical protein